MAKKVDLTISVSLPKDHGGGSLRIGPDGEIRMINPEGKEVIPTEVERTTHYERPKGRKVQSKQSASGQHASISGLDELCSLDHFIVVDTNSIDVDGIKISAAFFITCRLTKDPEGYRLQSLDSCGHVYEFHDVQSNPELLSIYRIANDILKNNDPFQGKPIGFVTDTELDKHQDYMSGIIPFYRDKVLPSGFKLFYASSDTGNELLNKLIRFCDKEAKKYLAKIQKGGIRHEGLMELAEDKSIKYRYTYFPSLEIENSIITGTAIGPNTTSSIEYS